VTDDRTCKIFLDGAAGSGPLIALVASHLRGTVAGPTITARYLALDVMDNDAFDRRARREEADGFLHARWILAVEPIAGAALADYLSQLTALILHLRWSDLQVTAACGFEDQLPPNRPARVTCAVAGMPCDQLQLAARELGFGGGAPALRLLPFTATFARESFVGLAGPLYRVLCDETRAEVARGLAPEPASLVQAGYPDLPALITQLPAAFGEVFTGHLALDFCQWWLGANASRRFRYVVNGIDRATPSADGASVTITGGAYEAP
jgi:hypothetical protein